MSGDVAELRSRIVRAVLLNEHGFAPFTSLKTSRPPLRAEGHWLSVFVPKSTIFETRQFVANHLHNIRLLYHRSYPEEP
jgi:hypothetical protein